MTSESESMVLVASEPDQVVEFLNATSSTDEDIAELIRKWERVGSQSLTVPEQDALGSLLDLMLDIEDAEVQLAGTADLEERDTLEEFIAELRKNLAAQAPATGGSVAGVIVAALLALILIVGK